MVRQARAAIIASVVGSAAAAALGIAGCREGIPDPVDAATPMTAVDAADVDGADADPDDDVVAGAR